MKTYWRLTYLIIVHLFAAIGLFLVLGYIAIRFDFTNTKGIIDLNRYLNEGQTTSNHSTDSTEPATPVDWAETEEYQSFKKSVPKDQAKINEAARVAGVNGRLIVSALLSEQIRLYTDASRESFKQFFQPLQILGIQSQYSWGVMGLKRDTAVQIEEHLKDPSSPFYLGPEYEHLLDFSTDDPETERFNRLIEKHNQYYSYLYAGLYIRQITKQWEDAGFPLDEKPEIIATLYNIGFIHSTPNPDPKTGGAAITVGGTTYSFGRLADEFYNSDELVQDFPRPQPL
jgi:hypothetical protein